MKADIKVTHIIAMAILVIALSVGVTIAQNFSVPSGTPGNADGNFGKRCADGQYVSSVTLSGGVVCKTLPASHSSSTTNVAGAPQMVLLWESVGGVVPTSRNSGTPFNLSDNLSNYKSLKFVTRHSTGTGTSEDRYRSDEIPVSSIPTSESRYARVGGDAEEDVLDGSFFIWKGSGLDRTLRLKYNQRGGSRNRPGSSPPYIFQIWGIKDVPSSTLAGTVPAPPVCNGSNQTLRWDGSNWNCGTISSSGGGGNVELLWESESGWNSSCSNWWCQARPILTASLSESIEEYKSLKVLVYHPWYGHFSNEIPVSRIPSSQYLGRIGRDHEGHIFLAGDEKDGNVGDDSTLYIWGSGRNLNLESKEYKKANGPIVYQIWGIR